MELTFTNLLIVVAIGFAAPLALGFVPSVRVPSVVIEIVLGIVVGPAVLGWVHVDDPVQVFATVGLAYLLFLAGLEIDFMRLRGRVLRLALLGFAVSLVLAIIVGLALKAGGLASPAAVRGHRAVGHLARRARPGAQGRRRDRLDLRAARHRRGHDRRLRHRDPALALLLARVGLHRVEGHPARRAVRGRGARRADDRRRRALPAAGRGPRSASRTRPRRSASAPPSSSSSGSWRWPPSSASRSSSAPSSPARSSRSSTATAP